MFYAKLNPDGSLERYPYTLTDLRRNNPGTSFPPDISDEVAASADQPAYDHTVDLSRTAEKKSGKWVEVWISNPATPEEIQQRTANKANEVRSERNKRLADCDWTQLPDAPVDRAAWATYRQALRDITKQAGFPWNVAWPVEP
jgi:hypothetical protein